MQDEDADTHHTAPTERRKPGPVPAPHRKQYVVMLDEPLAEWAKRQPEGLSYLLRRLLKHAYEEHQEGAAPKTPPA